MKCLIFSVCFLLIIFSCKKRQSVWDSDWTAPIVNDTISLNKYVNDSTLAISSSGMYEMNLHRSLIDISLASLVAFPDTTINKNFSIIFSSFVAAPGSSFVNSIEEHTMNLEGVELKKARLEKGFIDVKLQNPFATAVIFVLQLPGVTKDGVDFEQSFLAPQGTMTNPGIVEGTIDISGYVMDLTGVTGGSFNKLQSIFKVKTDISGPSITILHSDITKISATLRGIKMDYARGYFGNKVISDTTETTIDFLTHLTSGLIDLSSANLSFSISNGFKIPAKATLTVISNENSTGNLVPLTVSSSNLFQFGEAFNIDPATGGWTDLSSSVKTINFNELNSNVESYLENLGAKQKIGYSIQLNPWGNTSGGWNEIFPNSHLKVSIDASLPLLIGADGLTIRDTFDFNVKQNTAKTHVVSGELILKATNAFPMSGKISLKLLDESGSVIGTVNGSQVLQSSLFGNTFSSTGVQTCISEIHFLLPEGLVSKLEQIKKVSIMAEFNTPNPASGLSEQVLISEGAFLGVKLKGAFKVENRY